MKRTTFGPIEVSWGGDVLGPRPWTLAQSTWLAELAAAAPDGPILELFAGVGHIGLAAAALSGRALVQVEQEEGAAAWARRNADTAGIGDRVEVRVGDAAEVLGATERFPLIAADPPYLPSDEVDRFPDDPPDAVDGGPDGLDLIRLALRLADAHLVRPGGALVLQLWGEDQADQVRAWVEDDGLPLEMTDVRVVDEDRALAHVQSTTK